MISPSCSQLHLWCVLLKFVANFISCFFFLVLSASIKFMVSLFSFCTPGWRKLYDKVFSFVRATVYTNQRLFFTVMFPLYHYQQKHPLNFIFLGLFTVFLSLSVGVACANTQGEQTLAFQSYYSSLVLVEISMTLILFLK